jgi:chromatin remodeling complex protein RSC6
MEENQEESMSDETLVAEYDATFLEIRDGYLSNSDGFVSLSQGLAALLERGAEPTIENSNIQEIWEYAKNSFEPGATEVDVDEGAYFYLLRDEIDNLGGSYSDNTEEEDESDIPGFSSSVWTFEADDVREFVEEFHAWILAELQ